VADHVQDRALVSLQAPVAAATRAAQRGADLTRRLLAFSRRQILQPGRVDTGQLMHAMADMLRRTLDERLKLVVRVWGDGAGPYCRADPAELESALLNLAINARDAMPEGGLLSFSARLLDSLPDDVAQAFPSLVPVPYVELVVRDDGRGMSEAVRSHAFEPFFTTKEAGRGTGLGLSTVYGFAQQSLGAVTLSSAPGRGTAVALYLPAWPDGPAPASGRAMANELPQSLRVLVVEDDPAVREVVSAALVGPQREVVECASAEEAVRLLDSGARFDLLLSDIALGAGMRGSELAELVEQRWPALPLLLMTGYAADAEVQAARWPVLAKPFQRAALLQALAAVLS
jgi:CheY-like chemotaxis protein